MPPGHVGQGGGQRILVEHPGQVERDRDVVLRRRPLQLVENPQPLLAERQRQLLRARLRDQRRPLGRPALAQRVRQGRRGGRLEQQRKLEPLAGHRADAVQQPHREQGMAAQIEKAVIRADRRQAEHLRHQIA